jgi:xylulokinase
MQEAILSLDVGTTVVKAVLFDLSGRELEVAEHAYRLRTPQPGWFELEPEEMWEAVVQVLRAIANRSASRTCILAIGLATQGGTLIPCRADGTPTYNAITWMDRRSRDLVAQWWARGVGERVRQISGWSPEPGLPLPSIGWLRRAHPDIFAATERFLSVNDFVGGRLTGRFATNPSMAGEMLLADVNTWEWSRELCNLVEIRPEQLSPILPADATVGQVRPEVSRLTGFGPQTVVINGGQDHSCEALALGITAVGGAMLACGTAWVINGVADTPSVGTIPLSMNLNFHVVPGRWVASQFLGGLGACLEWWLNQCWQNAEPEAPLSRDELYASFDGALAETAPGCAGLLYLPQTGARQSAEPTQHGGFVGLRLDHTRADMGRAVLEGAAFELRWALENLRQAAMPVEQMWMIGGATRSPLWPQILADVTGVSLSLSHYTHGPALGAAILAGLGLGVFESMENGQTIFQATARQITPDDAHLATYDEQFAAYQRMAQVLIL